MKRWTVGDVMTDTVVTIGVDAPYKDIVETLAQHAVSAVPVVDTEDRVVGVVSEADLLHKLEFAGLAPHVHLFDGKRRRSARAKADADTARDLMTTPAVVIGPAESLAAAARLMDAERVKRLPVVDGAARVVGILSRRDLLRAYLRDDAAIRQEVIEEVLYRTLLIEPEAVTVGVQLGIVTLDGTVDWRSSVPVAVRLVGAVTGVVDVVSHLTYRYDDTRVTVGAR